MAMNPVAMQQNARSLARCLKPVFNCFVEYPHPTRREINRTFLACLALLAVLFQHNVIAQTPSFQWAKRVASTTNRDFELSIGMVLDGEGQCYVTGWFDGTNDFGGVTLTNTSAGGQDIFVAKYDSSGVLQWAKQAGGSTTGWDAGRGVGVDHAGNAYVTGAFFGTADFDGIKLAGSQEESFFLAKYDRAGTIQWVRESTGGNSVYGTALAVDGEGNSYAVGYADNGPNITFGTVNLASPSLTGYSAFFVKYDNSGTVQWAQLMGGSGQTYPVKVALDAAGNAYVRGSFSGNMTIGTSNLISLGSVDAFIAKFDSAGTLAWVRQAGWAGCDAGADGGVAVDSAGNVFISGGHDSRISFGGGIDLGYQGALDAFIAKYNSAGVPQWALQVAGSQLEIYWDIALDRLGNVYAAGASSSYPVRPDGNGCATIAKYDSVGTYQWDYSVSGPPADPIASVAAKVAVDSAGHAFLAGWYLTPTTFGTTVLQPQGNLNFFLAKLVSGGPIITSRPQSQTVEAGQHVSFSVRATGAEPLTYQWQRNGTNLTGAVGPLFNLRVQPNQAGNYTVVVSNATGFVTSAPPAVLTVNPTTRGTVVAWGNNENGQTNVPADLSGVTAIAASHFHTLALKQDGTVVSWGNDAFAQKYIPAGLSQVTAIAAGGFWTVALKNDGTVVTWETYGFLQPASALLSGVTAIAADYWYSFGLKSDGTVVYWTGGGGPYGLRGWRDVTAIATGDHVAVALKSDGTVVAQAHSLRDDATVPPGLSGVTAIAAGAFHTVALKSDGTVVAWGDNSRSQTSLPPDLRGVTAIAAGEYHTLALRSNGTVVAWGDNSLGQTSVPAGLSGITAIACGKTHSVALVANAAVVPAITAHLSGSHITLTWPTSSAAYRVESTISLSAPVAWRNVSASFQNNSDSISVVLPNSSAQTFFRLVKP